MDSKRKSLAKALSWRLIAVLITSSVAYLFTESATFALSLGVVDSLIKIFAYYLHERAWINAGHRSAAAAAAASLAPVVHRAHGGPGSAHAA